MNVWLALLIVAIAVALLIVATVVTAWRLRRRPPSRGVPPAPGDWEHSVGDHGSAGVFREHLE
ncbi:MAG TPA: hypothetical protein VF984_12050 [Actinomycetota bacterium]